MLKIHMSLCIYMYIAAKVICFGLNIYSNCMKPIPIAMNVEELWVYFTLSAIHCTYSMGSMLDMQQAIPIQTVQNVPHTP